MKQFWVFIFIGIFYLSCSNSENNEIYNDQLILVDSIFDLKGEGYFSFIKEIRIDQNEIFLLDERGKIYVFDTLMEFKYSFGEYGNGPKEIKQGTNLYVLGDSILIKDSRLSKMMIYSRNGEFIQSIRLPFKGWSKFLSDGNGVIVEGINDKGLPLIKLSYELDTLFIFGQKPKSWNLNISHHLHFFRDAIIAVPRVNEFNLQVYSHSGELIKVIDLEKMSPFPDWFNFEQIEKKSLASNGLVGQIIATDVAVSDQHVYFLFLSITKNEKPLPVYMVKMGLSEDWHINSLNTIELREAGRGPFHNFTVDKKGRNFYFFDLEHGGIFHYISEN